MSSEAVAAGPEVNPPSIQPVIVNSSLGQEDVARQLQLNNQFKVRGGPTCKYCVGSFL